MLKTGRVSHLQKTLFQSVRFSTHVTKGKTKTFEDIPGPARLPVVGSSWKYFPIIGEFDLSKMGVVAQTLYNRYGPIVRQKGGPFNVVHLYDPKDFEIVYKLCHQTGQHLRISFHALKNYRESKPHLYKTVGILADQGENWWNARKITQKPVSPLKTVRTYISQEDEIIKEFIEKICQKGKVDDYLSLANRLSMELTILFIFGERHYCFDYPQINPDSDQSKIMENIVNFLEAVSLFDQSNFYWSMPNQEQLKDVNEQMELVERFTIDLIEKVKCRKDPEDRCVVAQLLRDPENNPLELGSIIDLLYAGVDTTALVSNSLLHEIGMNKRVQDKMREEAVRLLPRGRESQLTEETLNQASYLKAAIKENFRLNPILTTQYRHLPESVELSGYLIPKDTIAFLELYASCRLESNFKDPLEFKPERWLKSSEDYEETNPYSILQFGLGIRTCIARRRAEQILQTIFLRILSEYEVSHDGEIMECITPFLVKPARPISFTFTKKTK